jgi:probable HAF family extracellular repeat protein
MLLGLAVKPAIGVEAPVFKFKNLSIPGALQTWLTGVNDSGVVVGWFVDQQGNSHGFSLVGDKLTSLNDASGVSTQPYAVNNAGDIVGSYVNNCAGEVCSQGFVYRDGLFRDIGPPRTVTTAAFGINDLGEFVGTYGDGFGGRHAFLWNGSTYMNLNGLSAVGINNGGLITVQAADSASNIHSFIYNGSTYSPIHPPGAKTTYAEAINQSNDVVMYWGDLQAGYLRGALLHHGAYFSFTDPAGVNCTLPLGLNNDHVIVGSWASGGPYDIHVQGFIATF